MQQAPSPLQIQGADKLGDISVCRAVKSAGRAYGCALFGHSWPPQPAQWASSRSLPATSWVGALSLLVASSTSGPAVAAPSSRSRDWISPSTSPLLRLSPRRVPPTLSGFSKHQPPLLGRIRREVATTKRAPHLHQEGAALPASSLSKRPMARSPSPISLSGRRVLTGVCIGKSRKS